MNKTSRKTFVLDTSILISDPVAYSNKSFYDSDIIIPIAVLVELDKLKKLPTDAGKNARVAIRKLDKLSDKGDIVNGIILDRGALLKLDATHIDLTQPKFAGFGESDYGDTQILALAYSLWLTNKTNVILVSNDINLRVKAKARGITSIKHETSNKKVDDLYTGCQTIVNEKAGLELQQKGTINPKNYNLKLAPNECLIIQDKSKKEIALGRRVAPDCVRLLKKAFPWGLNARNTEQTFLIDLICDKSIDLITTMGSSGTGKSLVALASALDLVLNKRQYDKLIIYRPIQPVSNDIGFTPGSISEKLEPWFQAIVDSFEFLFANQNGSNGDWKKELEMFQRKGKIEFGAITYIRGRSISNAVILLDECQNLTKDDVKTILTRAGDNTKIIITGDSSQIDARDLDATNNGLSHIIETFKESGLAGHITLTKGERSRLATLAASIL